MMEIIAVVAIIVAFVVGFKEQILSFWYRPRIEISISNNPPDCHKTAFCFINLGELDCYFYRIKVENLGRTAAKKVEVMASKLFVKQSREHFTVINEFLPQNLRWSFTQDTIFGSISPHMPKHCDLGHIKKSPPNTKKGLFEIEVGFRPMNRCHILGCNIYRLEVIVGASNVTPIQQTFEINHSGEWFDNEEEMFKNGCNIQIVS